MSYNQSTGTTHCLIVSDKFSSRQLQHKNIKKIMTPRQAITFSLVVHIVSSIPSARHVGFPTVFFLYFG